MARVLFTSRYKSAAMLCSKGIRIHTGTPNKEDGKIGSHSLLCSSAEMGAPVPLLVFRQEVKYFCKAVHGHDSIINWSFRARQEDKGTGAHNMGTCPLAGLSPRG